MVAQISLLFLCAILHHSNRINSRRGHRHVFFSLGDHGCQAGSALFAEAAVCLVSGVAPKPSGFITQILKVKFAFTASLLSRAREDVNTTFLPSGDNKGRILSAPVGCHLGQGSSAGAIRIHHPDIVGKVCIRGVTAIQGA